MALIGKVSAVFTANSSGLVSGVNHAASSMKRMEASTRSLAGGMRALVAIQGAQFFGNVMSSAANYARSLISMGQAQAQVIDRQSKLAARLGFTDSQLASLSLAGELAGVSMEEVGAAATKMNITLGKAAAGSSTATKGFANLGLSVDQLTGMSPDQQFATIAQAISEIPSEAGQAAAAVAVFGKSGANLLPLFQGGAAGIASAADQAQRLGMALTTAQADDVEAMNDAITLAGRAITGVVQQVTSYLAPSIKEIADRFTAFVGDMGGATIGQRIGQGIIEGARFLAGIGDYIIENFSTVFQYLSSVGEQWGAVMDFANRVGQFLFGTFKFLEAVGNSVAAGIAWAASFFFKSAKEGLEAYAKAAGENFSAAGAAMGAAFTASSDPVGPKVAGPLVTALDNAMGKAEASAQAIDEAATGGGKTIADAVGEAMNPQALRGVDSRSADGISEMFRLMRGGDNIQEEQRDLLAQIAANTAGSEEPDLAVDF